MVENVLEIFFKNLSYYSSNFNLYLIHFRKLCYDIIIIIIVIIIICNS